MRRALNAILLLMTALVLSPLSAQDLTPAQRAWVGPLKSAAEKNRNVNKTDQGTFYFKWLGTPPPDYDKGYFKLAELNRGGRSLSLAVFRKNAAGSTELTIIIDSHLNGTADDAYRGVGKTLQDADRAIAAGGEKTKIAMTGELKALFTSMWDQLKWELGAK